MISIEKLKELEKEELTLEEEICLKKLEECLDDKILIRYRGKSESIYVYISDFDDIFSSINIHYVRKQLIIKNLIELYKKNNWNISRILDKGTSFAHYEFTLK